MRLQRAIFVNRAPFEHLDLELGNGHINVLTGINGRGKTTILSYIVDAFQGSEGQELLYTNNEVINKLEKIDGNREGLDDV